MAAVGFLSRYPSFYRIVDHQRQILKKILLALKPKFLKIHWFSVIKLTIGILCQKTWHPHQTCTITEHALLNKLTSSDLIRQPCFQTAGIYMYIPAGINISVFEKVLLFKMMITYIPSCTKKNSSFVQYVNKVCFFNKNMKQRFSHVQIG